MADSTEEYSSVYYVSLMVLALMVVIPGLVIHSFIIGVNVNDWWKGRSVTPVDHVVTSIGISRMCVQCVDTIFLFVETLSSKNLSSKVTLVILDTVYYFFTYSNIWLTSLLSIVLCLKISNLHTRLFLYLRRMILHRTGHFIVAALIVSALNSLLPLLWVIFKVTSSVTYNSTMSNPFTNCIYIHSAYNFTTSTFTPLFFYAISSILLFTSLYHHTTRMKMGSNLSINLETYYSVMRFVSINLIYNTIYFIGQFTLGFLYKLLCVYLQWYYIFWNLLPLLHSCYLIYRTAKLRDQMSKVLHNVNNFLFHRKDTDTRENIEMAAQWIHTILKADPTMYNKSSTVQQSEVATVLQD